VTGRWPSRRTVLQTAPITPGAKDRLASGVRCSFAAPCAGTQEAHRLARLLGLACGATLERARRGAAERQRRRHHTLANAPPGDSIRLPQARVERLGDIRAVPHHAVLITDDVAGDSVVQDFCQ